MPENCRHWQGLLAEHILASRGRADDSERLMSDDLAEHLAGCQECQAAAAEFGSSAAALAHTTAPNATPAAAPISSGLSARISARVDQERRRRQRRRRLIASAAFAAALVLIVSLVVVRHNTSIDTLGERVALSAAGVQGDATLQARAWGTQIQLAATGFIPGLHYTVWLERADGSHIAAGTFMGVRNRELHVVLASALSSSEAIAIGISEPDGDLVVRTKLD